MAGNFTPDQQTTGSEERQLRRTVALFSGSPGSTYNFEKWLLWRGAAVKARDLGLNLIYVAGEEFEGNPEAVLYSLINSNNSDGIMTWSSFVSPRMLTSQIEANIRPFRPMAIINIEREVRGYASLLVDNLTGVQVLINHLVQEHGYQRIGFISEANNFTANARQRFFENEMALRGILDKRLIGSMEDLERKGMAPGKDYQALIVHSDYCAIETIEFLEEKRSVRIPEDVAVVGFNDGRDARGAQPPLTTVRLPFYRMGSRAVELLEAQFQRHEILPSTIMPVQLILRRSCGCLEPMAEAAIAGANASAGQTLEQFLALSRDEIVQGMARSLGTSAEGLNWMWAAEIFDAMTEAIVATRQNRMVGVAPELLRRVYDLLREAVNEGVNVSRWHDALTVARRELVPYLEGETLAAAEDLFQQVRVLIGQSAMRSEVHRNWRSERRSATLREIEASLLISSDTNELLTILAQGLERLGIRNFYLVLYDGVVSPQENAKLLLAYRNGVSERINPDEQVFPLSQLLPLRYIKAAEPYSLLIEALHFRDEQIGYIVFQTDPPADVSDCEIFKALQIQLSSALKSVRLRERLYEALREAEEANQLKSRFLSMVSHELRTPLNLIVGLSEMAMRNQSKGGKQALDVLRKYNEQIYVSGQHLDRLIRDVLDLASSQVGQMKLVNKPFDLLPVLSDAASMIEVLAAQKNLRFYCDLPSEMPMITGDKTRIRQVILNLLSNAVKFTANGEVVLTARADDQMVSVSVRDTGLGIAKEEQEKIFDEFQQSDRSAGLGYGGIGLGLAITRRLIEMHGGRIWVTSPGVEGSGSTFEFTLPVQISSGVGNFPAPSSSSSESRVLILSGQIENANELSGHLTRQGYSVEWLIVEGKDFDLEQIAQREPGAVVLDIAPASEMGWEIMKRLKEFPPTQDIPVLFYSLMIDRDEGSVVEMDYLSKPIGVEQLVDALKRHGVKVGRKEHSIILVVDDEPGVLEMNAQVVRTFLPESRVMMARDGVKALDMMRMTRPDVVLLDLLMPDLDGFGVIKRMQEEQSLRGIPVIVLSGQVLTQREMQRLNQGVAGVLAKGMFNSEEVFAKIESALSRSQKLGGEGQRLVFQAIGFIHEHFRESISRADIAGHLNVNEQYLSRCFNKEYGIGPMAYLSRYRIERAKHLLEEGNLSITQVALEVGLSSQSYFSRIFQQETGISPTAYQRGLRGIVQKPGE